MGACLLWLLLNPAQINLAVAARTRAHATFYFNGPLLNLHVANILSPPISPTQLTY